MQRPGATPAAGLAWTHPAAQFVYPQSEGRDVHRCFGNRARSWALLCIGDVTWRGFEPQRLTPASAALPDWPHQLGVAPLIRRGKLQATSPMQPAMGSRASGRLSGCHAACALTSNLRSDSRRPVFVMLAWRWLPLPALRWCTTCRRADSSSRPPKPFCSRASCRRFSSASCSGL